MLRVSNSGEPFLAADGQQGSEARAEQGMYSDSFRTAKGRHPPLPGQSKSPILFARKHGAPNLSSRDRTGGAIPTRNTKKQLDTACSRPTNSTKRRRFHEI